MKRLAALLLVATSTTAVAHDLPFRDASRTADRRAADLVARLTLAEKAAQLKDSAPGIPRLGIPAYAWWSEGLHGVAGLNDRIWVVVKMYAPPYDSSALW